ncbi:MAG: methyl-accepting chemotaxis protein, partial [Venatoribacter sp.]
QAEAQNAVNSMDNAQQTASQGMERVREAADALYTMTSHVERMNQLSQETLSLMQEQVGVGDEVSHKVSAIREHSEQSADTANNTLKVAESLVTMAQQLSQLVNRFKL